MALTYKEVNEILRYDPDTGQLFWKVAKARCIKIGDQAGYIDNINKYRSVSVNSKMYLAHRLIWLLYFKEWPKDQIDHVNRNGLDNRICNLREATQSENLGNAKISINNTSGYKGVSWCERTEKFIVRVQDKFIGYFDDPKKAHEAYKKAAKEVFKEFARFE